MAVTRLKQREKEMPIINIGSSESNKPVNSQGLVVSLDGVAIDHVTSIDIHQILPGNVVEATIVCAVTLGSGLGEGRVKSLETFSSVPPQ